MHRTMKSDRRYCTVMTDQPTEKEGMERSHHEEGRVLSIKLFVLVFLSTSIVHDQHSKQAVGTLTWMANLYIYPQFSQFMVLVTFIWLRRIPHEDTCMYVSPHSFPLPIHTHTCTLRFMITLEEASSPVQFQSPPPSIRHSIPNCSSCCSDRSPMTLCNQFISHTCRINICWVREITSIHVKWLSYCLIKSSTEQH